MAQLATGFLETLARNSPVVHARLIPPLDSSTEAILRFLLAINVQLEAKSMSPVFINVTGLDSEVCFDSQSFLFHANLMECHTLHKRRWHPEACKT